MAVQETDEAQVAQKAQWCILESIGIIILWTVVNSLEKFGQWLHFWAILTNLTNLLSRNLGKTQFQKIKKFEIHT